MQLLVCLGQMYRQTRVQQRRKTSYSLTDAQAKIRAEAVIQEYQTNLQTAEKKRKQFVLCQAAGLVLGGCILAAAAAGLVPTGWNLSQTFLYGMGVGVYAVFAAVSVGISRVNARYRKAADAILCQYNAASCEEISGLAEDYAKRWREAQQHTLEYNQIDHALEDHKQRRTKVHTELLDFVHTFAPEVSNLFGCSAALTRALGLEDQMRECMERAEHKRRHRDA